MRCRSCGKVSSSTATELLCRSNCEVAVELGARMCSMRETARASIDLRNRASSSSSCCAVFGRAVPSIVGSGFATSEGVLMSHRSANARGDRISGLKGALCDIDVEGRSRRTMMLCRPTRRSDGARKKNESPPDAIVLTARATPWRASPREDRPSTGLGGEHRDERVLRRPHRRDEDKFACFIKNQTKSVEAFRYIVISKAGSLGSTSTVLTPRLAPLALLTTWTCTSSL